MLDPDICTNLRADFGGGGAFGTDRPHDILMDFESSVQSRMYEYSFGKSETQCDRYKSVQSVRFRQDVTHVKIRSSGCVSCSPPFSRN